MVVEVRTQLEPIELDECLRLLAAHHLGRLAVVVEDQPLVFPVNYALSGRQIVFRTDPGTKLHAADGPASPSRSMQPTRCTTTDGACRSWASPMRNEIRFANASSRGCR